MTPQELHDAVLDIMYRLSLPSAFKSSYTKDDARALLWQLAARAYNEDCDRRRAEREAAR